MRALRVELDEAQDFAEGLQQARAARGPMEGCLSIPHSLL